MGVFLAPGITDGTPLSSAHDYKAKGGGGGILRCGVIKKVKRLQGTPLVWS